MITSNQSVPCRLEPLEQFTRTRGLQLNNTNCFPYLVISRHQSHIRFKIRCENYLVVRQLIHLHHQWNAVLLYTTPRVVLVPHIRKNSPVEPEKTTPPPQLHTSPPLSVNEMGKKSKAQSESQAVPESALIATPPNAAGNSDAPLFSADALTRLAQTIQTNFDKAKVQENCKSARAPKDTGKLKKKDLKDNRKELKVKDLPVGNPVEKSTSPKKSRSEEETNGTRGKKRTRDTDEPNTQRTAPPQPKSKPKPVHPKDVLPQKPGKKGKSKIDKEALLKEIIELGGTQEDLDLVNDVESDSEIEGTEFNDSGKAGKGLKDELAGFMKEIGLEGGKFDAVANEEEGEEWEEEAEDEGEEEEGGEEEVVAKAAPIAAAALPPGTKAKDSKLVVSYLVRTPAVKY